MTEETSAWKSAIRKGVFRQPPVVRAGRPPLRGSIDLDVPDREQCGGAGSRFVLSAQSAHPTTKPERTHAFLYGPVARTDDETALIENLVAFHSDAVELRIQIPRKKASA